MKNLLPIFIITLVQKVRRYFMSEHSYVKIEQKLWFERTVDKEPNHLKMYWEDRGPNRLKLIEILLCSIDELIFDRVEAKEIKVLEIGCFAGVNLKILEDKSKQKNIDIKFFGLEPNIEAYSFASEKLKNIVFQQGSDAQFEEFSQKYGNFDLIFVSAVFYVLDGISAKNLIVKMAISSKTIVIMDEIENCFEENTNYIRGKAFRHPYVTWLEECGFSCVAYRAPIKSRASNGYVIAKRIL